MNILVGGVFCYEVWDDWKLLRLGLCHNGLTTAAIEDWLNTYFRNGTPPTTWHLGLIDNTNFSALAAADTLASHAGWQELTAYDEATRPAWSPSAASGKTLTNSSSAIFTMTTDNIVKGLFVASDSTKGGTTGILWAHGAFPLNQSVPAGQTLKCFYDLSARQG